MNPPAMPFTALKDAFVTRASESAAQRLQKALEATEIGDAKPTQILHLLERQLEGMSTDKNLLTQFFM